MGTGPDCIHLMLKSAILLCDRDAHRKVKPFLLVRFLCGLPKKMNPVVGPGPDGFCFCLLLNIKPFKPSGLAPTGDWLSLLV